MSRESKLLEVVDRTKQQEVIHAYESFGWELLGLNGSTISMSRETQNPVYDKLLKYQMSYVNLESKKASLQSELDALPKLNQHSGLFYIFLFILCIFPLVLYLVWRNKKQAEYNVKTSQLRLEINKCNEDIEKVINDSRATFFARQ